MDGADKGKNIALLHKYCKLQYFIKRSECKFIHKIDASQVGIFGGGLLISDACKNRLLNTKDLEKPQADKRIYFELSDREKAIIDGLK